MGFTAPKLLRRTRLYCSHRPNGEEAVCFEGRRALSRGEKETKVKSSKRRMDYGRRIGVGVFLHCGR